ncbi:response regulator [Frankia sp. Cppng1_Ct_nod]|uniref:response regulator n=1 Tax=Frankia sp. Cppng1_Ct_nod TaxID=2897162 RepID=UPI001041748F|nr:response regulator [Frankia sp. Cppng1_Ct_nod]
MSRVLVVDDEPQIVRALRINLCARGYDVQTAADGRQALSRAGSYQPDIIVLDLGLPDLDGVEVIRGVRGWSTIPIIVLSGRAGSSDKVAALDAGADDYVTKPFDINELLARLRAVSRRTPGGEDPSPITVGNCRIDLAARTATCTTPALARTAAEGRVLDGEDRNVRLTPTEWALLEVLLRHPGKLVSQRQLLVTVWGPSASDSHYLREYMARLRRKLEPDPSRPRHLLTEPGMGCRFQP